MRRPIKLAGSKPQSVEEVKPVEKPVAEEPKVEEVVEEKPVAEEPKVEEVEEVKTVSPKPLYTQKKKSAKKETK